MAYMTKQLAMEIAERSIGDECTLSHHTGDYDSAVAICISGCFAADAERLGRELVSRFPFGAAMRSTGWSVLVWYDLGVDYDSWLARRAENDREEIARMAAEDARMEAAYLAGGAE